MLVNFVEGTVFVGMIKNRPLFSIIVACYNVEKYIEKCIVSILNQSFGDYELIVVDDGSTDKTAKIVKQLQHDNQFIYLRKNNGGLSSVRNYGIEHANGKYIIQFDGDDFVNHNWLKKISKIALYKKPDMIFWGGRAVDEKGDPLVKGVKQQYNEGAVSSKKFLYYLAENKAKNWSWGFAFKRDLVEENDLPIYPDGITFEDLASTYKLVKKANKIFLLSGYPYNYTQHSGTITKSPSIRQYNDLEVIKKQVQQAFSNDKELKNIWTFQITMMQYQIVSRIRNSQRKKLLLNQCTKIILNNKSNHLTKSQLVKYYLVKSRVYSHLYSCLYKYRN